MSRLSIEIPEDLHRAIKSQASLRGLSLREYVLRRLRSNAPVSARPGDRRFSDAGLAGMWGDREDMSQPQAWVRDRRQPRTFGDSADAD